MNKNISASTRKFYPLLFSKEESSFIICINLTMLITYFILNVLSMRRYFVEENVFILSLAILKLILRIIILSITVCKIIYYRKIDLKFSLISATLLVFGIVYFLFKYNFVYIEFITNWPDLLSLVFLIIASYGISLDAICIVHLLSIGISFILRVVLAISGIMPGVIITTDYGEKSTDLGFGNHNAGMIMFLFIVFSFAYLLRSISKKYIFSLIILFLTYFLYSYTHSKTSTIVLILFCIMYTCTSLGNYNFKLNQNRKIRNLKKIAIYIMTISPILSLVMTIVCTLIYNIVRTICPSGIAYDFITQNTLLSRFNCISQDFALNNIPLPFNYTILDPSNQESFNFLLGSYSKSYYNDNLYHRLFINYGIIILLIFILVAQIISIYANKKNYKVLLVILSMISLFNIMESHGMIYSFNPFVLIPFSIITLTLQPPIK